MNDDDGPIEVAWFGALCDDDYEFLGVAEPERQSSWEHCSDIVLAADRLGFDNVLLPSGYELGIDPVAFAAAIATRARRINHLLAVRMGELWLPQLARQLATIDQFSGGRLTINIISSDIPGQALPSEARYRRTSEWMEALRLLMSGRAVDMDGEFVSLHIDPPRILSGARTCAPFYFGGFSEDAKNVAARHADVFLTWPDTVQGIAATVADMRTRAGSLGRAIECGLRIHVIVRETEDEARQAARMLVSRLDPKVGEQIRRRSLDAQSLGVQRQTDLRDAADSDGFVEECLWTGIGRARSGAGAAIVGDPDQVLSKIDAYRRAGVGSFIFSGYPHLEEANLFGRYVLPSLSHAPLKGRVRSGPGSHP
jgi:alkanesulfonate monooxygenase